MRIYASLVFVSHGVVNACETNTRLEPARTWPLPIQRPGVPTGVRKDLAATQTIMRVSLYSNVLYYVDKYTNLCVDIRHVCDSYQPRGEKLLNHGMEKPTTSGAQPDTQFQSWLAEFDGRTIIGACCLNPLWYNARRCAT